MNKRSIAVLFFIIAVLLAVFSFSATFYIDHAQAPKGQTIQNDGGKIELAILPQENTTSSISAGNSP
jgi:hypothetical protein